MDYLNNVRILLKEGRNKSARESLNFLTGVQMTRFEKVCPDDGLSTHFSFALLLDLPTCDFFSQDQEFVACVYAFL